MYNVLILASKNKHLQTFPTKRNTTENLQMKNKLSPKANIRQSNDAQHRNDEVRRW